MTVRLFVAGVIVVVLSGCGSALRTLTDNSAILVGAEPMAVTRDEIATADAATSGQVQFIGRMTYDSIQKCDAFLRRLVLSENTINTTGDILATILSALATAVQPVNTIHALTAGSTIVTGTKSAINADIYAKASTANFHSALQQTYYKAMYEYLTKLPALQNPIPSVEASNIATIHATCSLAAAQASIAATIAEAAGGGTTRTPPGSTGSGGGTTPGSAVPTTPGAGGPAVTAPALPGAAIGPPKKP